MTEGVYLYEHINYKGYELHIKSEGDFNMNDLLSMGIKNDDISSLRIVGDFEVEMYEHINFNGNKYTSRNSIDDFRILGWNDRMTSIKIKKINNNSPSPSQTPTPSPIEENSNIYTKVRDAVVTLTMIVENSAWVGSGFFYEHNNDYYICTVAHNVITNTRNDKIDKIYASISNINNTGENKIIQCSVIGVAGNADLAVLRVQENIYNQKTLEFTNSRNEEPGNKCYVIGDPRGIDAVSICDGIIRDNKYIYNNLIESMCVSAPIYGGNSGGPITNSNGEVIGLISYGLNNTDTISWGASSYIAENIFIKMINSNSNFIGGTLNASLYPVDAIYSYINNLIPNKLEGYYVDNTNNSTLNKNDIILKIWNKKIGLYHNQQTPVDIYLNPNMSLSMDVKRNSNDILVFTSIFLLSTVNDKPMTGSNEEIELRRIGPIVKVLPEDL